jgi:uncharacterized protein (UPF0548 family)
MNGCIKLSLFQIVIVVIVASLGEAIIPPTNQDLSVLTNYQRKNASTLDKLRRSLSTHWIHHKSCVMKHKGSLGNNTSDRNQRSTASSTRTRFLWTLPSRNDLYDLMFASSGNNIQNRQIFNHDYVGFTKPTDSSSQLMSTTITTNASSSSSSSSLSSATTARATIPTHTTIDHEWWPNSDEKEGWTLKRYTRRIGKGTDCYNSVKDKILDWEFAHQDKCRNDEHSNNPTIRTTNNIEEPSCGILRAIPKGRHKQHSIIPENINQNVFQICNDPMMNICRKLVTFTKFDLVIPFLPKKVSLPIPFVPRAFYAVNPVAVVYDIVDERVPTDGSGGMYTSSAYATLKGHLLSGEERVTVIMRGDDRVDIGSILPATAGKVHEILSHDHASRSNGGWVDVEIVSYSKAAPSLLGRIVWPFVGTKQDSFFTSELDALEQVARQTIFQ